MTVTVRVPSVRSLALVFAGVLLGILLVAPVFAREGTPVSVEPAAIQTRAVSCHGMNFHPAKTATGYSYHEGESGPYLFRWVGPFNETGYNGDGYYLCDPDLPHQAVITKVQFSLIDAAPVVEVRYCALFRMALGAATSSAIEEVAQVQTTGMAQTPGKVRYADTSILHATVNNINFAYYLQCQINFSGAIAGSGDAGIYGASVTYTISSANG